MQIIISRREFIAGAASVAAIRGARVVEEVGRLDGRQVREGALKQIAEQHGILYGSAATKTHLSSDQTFAEAFTEQCSILVPEVELKWDVLRPSPEQFNFGPADWLQHFTWRNQMKF